MTENDLIGLWVKARFHVIASQLGPIFLLTATIWLLINGLREADVAVRIAAAGILLATGILGAAAQIAAATEGMAVVHDLRAGGATSRLAAQIEAFRPWLALVRLVAPAIFVLIYLAILWALFLSPA